MQQETKLTQNDAAPTGASHSFRVKSIAVSWVVIMVTALYAATQILGLATVEAAMPGEAWQIVAGAMICVTLVEVVLQAVLAIGAGKVPAATELDRMIAARATRNAYWVLLAGVYLVVGGIFLNATPFMTVNALLLFFVFAELIKLTSQLVYYRAAAKAS